jgi:hypothetical protein
MKRWLRILLTITIVVTIIFALLTRGFQKGVLTGIIYTPDNVYEEIWNLVKTEELTRSKTILTSSTEDAYVDWDFGFEFVGVYIPEIDFSLNWWLSQDELAFSFWYEDDEKDVQFIYEYHTKTLYGDAEFSYLMDHFLMHYFKWCGEDPDYSSNYSADSLGKFTYKYVNPLYMRNVKDS